MPNISVDRFGDPIDHSIISHNHPANARRHSSHDEHGRYTFRTRSSRPLDFTLGWELEANHEPSTPIPSGIEQIGDGSVNGAGAEFVVLPAVTKSPRYVLGLLKDLVHAPRLNTDDSCGFHVHVSASNLSSLAKMRQWAIATEHLAIQIEDLAFEAVPDSRKGNTYCKRIVPLTSGQLFESNKYNNTRRYHWLNTVEMFRPNGIRTIENRLLGHTHRWKYVLAWSLFSMELARRGWELSLKPFDSNGHVDALSDMLKRISKEIKPLAKKSEPIPQWVYTGLATFGIEPNAWERPLARLSEAEAYLKGYSKPWYSDDQPEEENESSEDECSCGCGTEGRCDYQVCDDGDCSPSECDRCHENENCGGTPDCERCIENAHENDEDCGRRACRTCHPTPRAVNTPRPVTGSSNVTIHASNVPTLRYGSSPLTAEAMQAAVDQMRNANITPLQEEVNHLHNITVDNTNLQITAYQMFNAPVAEAMRDSVLYGRGVADMVWIDEAAHVPVVEPSQETERRAYMMLDVHEQALSTLRDDSIRIIEERANNMMSPLERDASIERAEIRWGQNQRGY